MMKLVVLHLSICIILKLVEMFIGIWICYLKHAILTQNTFFKLWVIGTLDWNSCCDYELAHNTKLFSFVFFYLFLLTSVTPTKRLPCITMYESSMGQINWTGFQSLKYMYYIHVIMMIKWFWLDFEHFLWCCHKDNGTVLAWGQVNIGSGMVCCCQATSHYLNQYWPSYNVQVHQYWCNTCSNIDVSKIESLGMNFILQQTVSI